MQAKIKLAYRQIIDASSKGVFEQDVFIDSYNEFKMQAQAYNPERKLNTFQELISNNPKANSLHYKVGFAIGLYVKGLGNLIPGLQDSLGRINIPFLSHRFEIIESDLSQIANHKVAVIFESDGLALLAIVGEYLLLAPATDDKTDPQPVETFMLRMQPNLAIVQWQGVEVNEKEQLLG